MEPTLAYGLPAAFILYLIYKRVTKITLDDIRGPEAETFWLGNLGQLFRSLVGEADFAWQDKFGGVARIKGPVGQDILWVCDPRAMQFIMNGAYKFPKTSERVALGTLSTDRGLVTAQDDCHKRQRKAMLPAFGTPESKALFPIFVRNAEAITTRWRDQLFDSPEGKMFNIPTWVSCATLDAIGEAAFDHTFGAIDNQTSDFVKSYQSLLIKSFASPTDGRIIMQNLSRYLPVNFVIWLYDHLPLYKLLRKNREVAHKFGKEILASKDAALAKGADSHDLLAIIVRSNMSENERSKLTDYEVLSQIRTILLAGHETTSTALSWGLLELAKNPAIQSKLRAEIHAMDNTIKAHGRSSFTVEDLDKMPYTQACLKEVLRFHPPVYHLHRAVGQDTAIPLSKPVTTKSGTEINEVPVAKGTSIVLSIAAYNRDKSVWGEDAHVFNPERWLNQSEKKDISVGIFSNLATFAGGPRACIGWRFAVYEIQAFMIELVSNFEFNLTEDCKLIRREPVFIMAPTVEGQVGKGAQMPLKVTLAQRGE
ncbi:hypothetical protein EIP91_008155 [Steccherinum ochraceum]|uniref:Cytochrome P450-dit2 n=1 Tax=Steccherinum ochraceum TaxID=92696 RepID=A0A4R0R385_9APHY|nr:hypothetical protein EIP91_008155 [Steccherinum ochraceum]